MGIWFIRMCFVICYIGIIATIIYGMRGMRKDRDNTIKDCNKDLQPVLKDLLDGKIRQQKEP